MFKAAPGRRKGCSGWHSRVESSWRGRGALTHAGQIPRGTSTEEHQGWAPVWLWLVEGVGDAQRKERFQVGLDKHGWMMHHQMLALLWEISSPCPGTVSIQVSLGSEAKRWGSSRTHSASATCHQVLGWAKLWPHTESCFHGHDQSTQD